MHLFWSVDFLKNHSWISSAKKREVGGFNLHLKSVFYFIRFLTKTKLAEETANKFFYALHSSVLDLKSVTAQISWGGGKHCPPFPKLCTAFVLNTKKEWSCVQYKNVIVLLWPAFRLLCLS